MIIRRNVWIRIYYYADPHPGFNFSPFGSGSEREDPKIQVTFLKSLIKSLCITIFCTSHLKKKKIQILALRNSPDPHLSMRIRILTAFLNADPGGFGSETLFKRNFSTKHGLYFTFIIEQRNHYFSIEVGTGI